MEGKGKRKKGRGEQCDKKVLIDAFFRVMALLFAMLAYAVGEGVGIRVGAVLGEVADLAAAEALGRLGV